MHCGAFRGKDCQVGHGGSIGCSPWSAVVPFSRPSQRRAWRDDACPPVLHGDGGVGASVPYQGAAGAHAECSADSSRVNRSATLKSGVHYRSCLWTLARRPSRPVPTEGSREPKALLLCVPEAQQRRAGSTKGARVASSSCWPPRRAYKRWDSGPPRCVPAGSSPVKERRFRKRRGTAGRGRVVAEH